MASTSLQNSISEATIAKPTVPRIRFESRHTFGSGLPCRFPESQFPTPRNWCRGDLSDSSPETEAHESLLCQSVRNAIESDRLCHGVARAASRVLGLVEARRSLAVNQAIDHEVLQTVSAELLKVRTSSSIPARILEHPEERLPSSVHSAERDDMLSGDPWEGCEDVAAEDLCDWFNESLSLCTRNSPPSLAHCQLRVPQTWARLRPAPREDEEKFCARRPSFSSTSTVSNLSRLERLSTVSTGGLSSSSTLSSARVDDICVDHYEKHHNYTFPRSDAVKGVCRSVGSLQSSERERSGMTWQQMWHQRLLSVRCAISARGERTESFTECIRPLEERCNAAG